LHVTAISTAFAASRAARDRLHQDTPPGVVAHDNGRRQVS